MAEELIPKKVTFTNLQGQAETRDIYSPGQLEGFKKAGFTITSNPFDTSITKDVSSPLPNQTNPVISTNGLREEENVVKAEATKLGSDIESFADTQSKMLSSILNFQVENPEVKRAAEELARLRGSLGMTTAEEQAQIEAAGIAAGRRYDPIIAEAAEAKRQGMAKATVGSGERGGFMNTQFAGQAALTPTEGGTFVGTGGELERVKGVYDRNIDNLKVAKEEAIFTAKQAAQRALETGKREDYALAAEAFDRAQAASMNQLKLMQEKVTAINSYQQMADARKASALDEIAQLTKIGQELPEQLVAVLDANYGAGFTEKYKKLVKAQQKQLDEKTLMDSQKDLVDILSKVPDNQTLKIGDTEYTGMKETDPKKGLFSFTETAADGTVRQVVTRMNPETGTMEIVGNLNLGRIGKPSGGSGGGSSTDKIADEFLDEASKLIKDLDNPDPDKKIEWKTAYDTLATKYGRYGFTGDIINGALGGGIPYDSNTGEFDTSNAWGRAVMEQKK